MGNLAGTPPSILRIVALLSWAVAYVGPLGDVAHVVANEVDWHFFAFDNGIGRDKGWTPQQQATLTSKLGYDGIGYTRVEDLDARFAACDDRKQRIFSYYESFTLGAENSLNPATMRALPRLQDRDAILWIHVHGQASEEEAVASLRDLADEADKYGVRVAIYPHVNNYVETGRHALQLARVVDRNNLGMTINVCHELKVGNGDDLVALARDSIDHLFLVSINGTDRVEDPQSERNWSRLIKPLGEGDFDLLPFLKQLHRSGYRGPVGLQCYQVRGEVEEVLAKSMQAWRGMIARIPSVR